MKVDVINMKNKKVGDAELPDDVFAVEVKESLLWAQVKAQLASRRRGTHKTKKRGEVSGGGIKPYRQKGTGRARQGSIRSPQFVGGGTVFGPQPRSYDYRLPRSARRSALRNALSLRAKDGLIVLDELKLDAPKTKVMAEFIAQLGSEKVLLVDVNNDNAMRSTRNLARSKYLPADAINVYDVLNYDKLVMTRAAIPSVVERASKAGAQAEA